MCEHLFRPYQLGMCEEKINKERGVNRKKSRGEMPQPYTSFSFLERSTARREDNSQIGCGGWCSAAWHFATVV